MPTTLDQREQLVAEFDNIELLFEPGNVPQERLDELMEIMRCDIAAARLAIRNELARIQSEAGHQLSTLTHQPLPNPIPLP